MDNMNLSNGTPIESPQAFEASSAEESKTRRDTQPSDTEQTPVTEEAADVQGEMNKVLTTTQDNNAEQADDILTSEESFMVMSPEEQEAWKTMMKMRKKEMAQRQEDFEKWLNNITRRRMYALSKMKKIEKISRERTLFYDEIRKHLHKAASKHSITAER